MESTLHRQLKEMYGGDPSRQEVQVDGYRIDAVVGERLVEVQAASLGSIRPKIRRLVERHQVLVVKPVTVRKLLIKRQRKKGRIESQRYSPLRGNYFDLFLDLVHFVDVFPHANLELEVLLVELEEHRIIRRRSRKGYAVEDRRLTAVRDRIRLATTADLNGLLPEGLPDPFTTKEIAAQAGIPRWLAQKVAYCLRKTGAARTVGKQRNSLLYSTAYVDRVERAAA